jgi:hypothetical protein
MNASNPLPRKRLERRKRLGEAGKKEIHPCNYQFIYLFIHPFVHLLLMIINFFRSCMEYWDYASQQGTLMTQLWTNHN